MPSLEGRSLKDKAKRKGLKQSLKMCVIHSESSSRDQNQALTLYLNQMDTQNKNPYFEFKTKYLNFRTRKCCNFYPNLAETFSKILETQICFLQIQYK